MEEHHHGAGGTEDPLDEPPRERNCVGGGHPDLRLQIVDYHESSNRGTIHPSGLTTRVERMEMWLSADVSAFVALTDWR